MKTSLNLLLILVVLQLAVYSQNKEYNNEELLIVAKEIMVDAGTCALITLDNEGNSRVRAMSAFSPENDLTVWFGTNPKSRKVDQIKNDPRVTLYYLDKDASGYVMILGEAELIDDSKMKLRYWKKEWENFYPNYPSGYLLLKVVPKSLEIVSESRGIIGNSETWEPNTIDFNWITLTFGL
ncbi:MAG: pyridoxamine 5'-phosphate oxidase family protein [Prolixibacteraceae bacterium]|jgi:general stress protein 26|nr:pyridoxamine 5'-phosphate oxidase family protein [Prolixibacteraceae bacterium]